MSVATPTRRRPADDPVTRYIRLGLALGRHVDGFVDAYYGPPALSAEAAVGAPTGPAALAEEGRRLLADLQTDGSLEAHRRTWLAAQVRGLHTSARKLAGEEIAYLDEIEACYGVRPTWTEEDDFAEAHRRLDRVLPRTGEPLAERYNSWREVQVVPPEKLHDAIESLAEDFRDRTRRAFGLPEGERVEFVLEGGKPWSGFNYYLGDLRSRVAMNTDLPILSLTLAHVVAHESYPGHHTEHSRKEAGLVRRRHQMEETIFLVGTPQCLIAEGLADLGLEVIAGARPEAVIESHLAPLGIPYDAGVAGPVAEAGEKLGAVIGNAAIGVHDRGWSPDQAVEYLKRWALRPEARAAKSVQFLTDPTWRAYQFCYIDGFRLCRRFVGGEPARFERLISEQLIPDQLVSA
ncbi:MAG: DUF885 domain-containing protein [Actinomycetota bacterium]|nr:DUF885 domain-containing protein [Actinomycetota bacterium]